MPLRPSPPSVSLARLHEWGALFGKLAQSWWKERLPDGSYVLAYFSRAAPQLVIATNSNAAGAATLFQEARDQLRDEAGWPRFAVVEGHEAARQAAGGECLVSVWIGPPGAPADGGRGVELGQLVLTREQLLALRDALGCPEVP